MLSERVTILCVDDQAVGLFCRKLILEQKGYRVLTATTAAQALQLFEACEVALVITDHLLGADTGGRMASEMRLLKPQVPILILSGLGETPEGAGHADAFMSKTEGPEKLLNRVTALLRRNSEVCS